MKNEEYGILSWTRAQMSVVEYLENTSFDEMVEIDLQDNLFRQVFHVSGKYFVPMLKHSFTEIYAYCRQFMVHPEDQEIYDKLMAPDTLRMRLEQAEVSGVLSAQFRYKMLDGSWHWVEQIAVLGDIHGFGSGKVRCYVFDIEILRNRRLGIENTYSPSRNYDALTGLLKEKAFLMLASSICAQEETAWCVLSIGIEKLYIFNSWYGKETGSFLLSQIGSVLKMEENHLGGLAGCREGEDFCMLLPFDKQRIGHLYEKLDRVVREHTDSLGFPLSIGICLVLEGESIKEALHRADLARHRMKGEYKKRIQLYDPSLEDPTKEEHQLLTDFHRGLQRGEFVFFLQPQCSISTKEIVGAEALGRWRRADGRVLQPDAFLPVLEKYGFISDFDRYIWEEICRWMQGFGARGYQLLPVSVNISKVDMFVMDVPEYVDSLLKKYELPRGVIKFEFTESVYASDPDKVASVVGKLRDKGFAVLASDFGKGYTSLDMIRNIAFDAIKLGKWFHAHRLGKEDRSARVLEAIINLTKSADIPVIVEGVETAQQEEYLKELGCRCAQGYYYYRPLPKDAYEKLFVDEENLILHDLHRKSYPLRK